MKQYIDLVSRVLCEGDNVPDRTGVGRRRVFGHRMAFDLNEGFPLVTVKRTFWRGAFVEMLWFLRGETNIAWLHEHGVHIWDEWADEGGELGPIYGFQWRNLERTDQIDDLVNQLAVNPFSSRHIIESWNVRDLPIRGLSPNENASMGKMALPPCHKTVQFFVSDDYRISCQVYQRSADVFLGVPFNIAGYALFTHLLAHHLGYGVGELVWIGGDCHLYSNHIKQAAKMLERDPMPMPTLELNYHTSTPLWEVEPDDLQIVCYDPHPAIKGEVAV